MVTDKGSGTSPRPSLPTLKEPTLKEHKDHGDDQTPEKRTLHSRSQGLTQPDAKTSDEYPLKSALALAEELLTQATAIFKDCEG